MAIPQARPGGYNERLFMGTLAAGGTLLTGTLARPALAQARHLPVASADAQTLKAAAQALLQA